MKLVMLGTTGYHPNHRRHTACFMIPEAGVVLDAGTAMFRVREHLATSHLDIFLSHAHLDHIVGLTYLFDVLEDRRCQRVVVHAEPEKLAAVRQHLLAPLLFPVALPCEYRPLANETPLAGGGRLRWTPLAHPGGAAGFRLDWPGHSMAYITDTTARHDAPYIEFIHGVDLLVHECYFPDGKEAWAEKTGHSCTTPVAQVARAANVGQLVLVHIDPASIDDDPIGLDVARAIFPRTQIGEDGTILEF
jgi:ribonuclease Z